MVNLEALQTLKEALAFEDIETGTTLNILVYKAFVGEPFYPTIAPLVKSKAPFFECQHLGKRMVAPEPPYYSTNFNTFVQLVGNVIPTARVGLDQMSQGFCISLTDDQNSLVGIHDNMHVAGLKVLTRAVEEGWPLPRA